MVVIEASHIGNRSGGYSLLVELLKRLTTRSIRNKVYISHEEVYYALRELSFKESRIVLTSSLETIFRYWKRREHVLFFCNLPPFRRNKRSVLYFHNEGILDQGLYAWKDLKYYVFRKWLKIFHRKVDTVAVQTDNISNKLVELGIINNIKLPFFEENLSSNVQAKRHTFCYPCSGAAHKNLPRLVAAINNMKGNFNFTFAVTLESCDANREILEKIAVINKSEGREIIVNYGLIGKKEVINLYYACEALVYPSLKESMGLPLIEASMCGIKILSSDLSFTHELINNPIVFDPYDVGKIRQVMSEFILGKYAKTQQSLKIKNEIDKLINTLN
jgi:glycosyltransferase involved in cell wall biosynthesis